MKLLYSYLRQYKSLVLLALVLATINQVFSLINPGIFQHIVDSYLTKKNLFTSSQFYNNVLTWIGISLGVAMVSRIAKNFQDYFTNVVTQKVGVQIYTDGIRHSLELPYSVFEDQRSGETLGILQKVRDDIQRFMQAFISVLFTTLVGVVFVFVYAMKIYWLIAPVYFSIVPILAFVSSFLTKKIKKIQTKIVSETTALAGSTTESLRNIELVKSLGLAEQEIGRLNSTTVKILGLELKKVRYIRSISFVQGTIVNLLQNIILFMLIFLIFNDRVTIGQMFALQIYSFFIFGPLQELGNIINTFRETQVSLDNFSKILNTPKDPKPEKPVKLAKIESLEFENVTFKHQTATGYALEDISFKTELGQTIAFVGPSGSGKTTLVKLLVGLYPAASGEILYNNISGKEIDLDKLREQIGLVTQDAQLFSGSIKENLLFVAPNATDKECLEVLHKAACENLLARADKGLDTVIGEGGVKVSGGEKQRLSIARALLRKPNLLVFDEATSALDSLTEEEISKTIRDVSQNTNHITILIAHRLSTIMHADKIHVLEKGHIIESGKHEELLEQKGLYYAMWRQQIGERKTVKAKPAVELN
ncbi:MAG TPA: ABC transporter ATP-binding protein [Bacteroidia bacterium]|nr:ABC transporter ATP-binding protein [Bacteroidia bacterium]